MRSRNTATAPTIEHVRAAMRRPLPGPSAQVTMAPRPRPFAPPPGVAPRQAGVLLCLYPIRTVLHLVLTVRTPDLNHHSAQISLPGGGWEEGDASLQETALREAREEIGITTEVAELLQVPLHLLLDPATRREEDWTWRGAPLHVPFYAVSEQSLGRDRYRAGRVPGVARTVAGLTWRPVAGRTAVEQAALGHEVAQRWLFQAGAFFDVRVKVARTCS